MGGRRQSLTDDEFKKLSDKYLDEGCLEAYLLRVEHWIALEKKDRAQARYQAWRDIERRGHKKIVRNKRTTIELSELGLECDLANGTADENLPIDVVLKGVQDKSKAAGHLEVVGWVFENMFNKDVTIETAPSPGAYGLWKMCQDSEKIRADFYTQIWMKLAPSRQELDDQHRFQDDGREVLPIIGACKLAQEMAEREAG